MKKRIMLVLFALALLAALVISLYAAPAEDPAVLNQVNAAAVQMTFPTDGSNVRQTCPYCNVNALWLPLPAATTKAIGLSGHYYLPGDMTSNTQYYIPYDNNVCLNLNGHSIKTTYEYAIEGKTGYEFNIMGNGNVEAAGSRANGTVAVKAGTVRLFGGTYTTTNDWYVVSMGAADTNLYMYDGATINGKAGATSAVVCAQPANLYLYGGIINANKGTGLYLSNGTTYLAGVTVNAAGGRGVYVAAAAATVEQSAGTVTGATRNNVYMTAGTYNLSGGEITGGNREGTGGNVMLEGTGVFHMTGGTISKGSAYNGGNVYIAAGTLRMENGTITEGQAVGSYSEGQYYYFGGGNIYVNDAAAAVANISGGTVSDGTATNNSGGNILCRGAGTLTVSGGNITGGTAGSLGGNIMNGASAKVTISGGTISEGASNTLKKGGRYHGDNVASFGGTLTVSGGTIKYEGTRVGAGIFACYNATLILDGDAQVTNSGKTGNIYVSTHLGGTPKLQVKSTFTGEAGVQWNTTYGYGDTVASTAGLCDGTYSGQLYYEGLAGNPWIVGVDGDLVIVTARLVKADGTAKWYADNASALADYANFGAAYIHTSANELELPGGSYTVDLAGESLNITGTGNVTCFDSANDDYTANGSATFSGVTLANETMTEVNGKQYVMLNNGGTYTFHRLDMRVNGVSLRPSVTGIYYTCVWNCDKTLQNALGGFGVVVSTAQMPDSDFQSYSLYTANGMDTFECGVTKNSALIRNIFKANEDNDARGKQDIYAAPYVLLGDEYLLPTTGVAYSFCDVMKLLDADKVYTANMHALERFYVAWHDAMRDWGFQNIGKAAFTEDPAEDNVLRVLMVGDSFCYYYTEELCGLLENAGYTAEIYNLYCDDYTLKEHYNWWLDDAAKYQLFKTDSNGRKEQQAASGKWTLEEALAVGNWDYISLQGTNGGSYIEVAEDEAALTQMCAEIASNAEPLLDRFYTRFPNAQLLWQRTWAFEAGYVDGDTTYTEQMLADYDAGMRKVCDYMCNTFDQNQPYDLKLVNSGAAWTEARELNAALETSLIPTVGGLCARWEVSNANTYPAAAGNGNAGDGYHDGDIGGGQLLNAYVWYMTLTGDANLSDNSYVPNYFRASGDLVDLLKEAAQNIAGLQIGYGRVDITPDHINEYPVTLWSDNYPTTQTVKDDLYVTCVAIRNGKETVLLYSLDMLSVYDSFADPAKTRITANTGVPAENILMNATHNHSSVAIRYKWDGVEEYRQEFYAAAVEAAITAIADLSAVSNTYAGGTQTESLAFVRHYINGNGGVCGSNFGNNNSGYASHVDRDADQELQLVRFEREGKKDVLLMSFPAHATFFEEAGELSADYPGYARSYVEQNNEDMLVAVFQGASGDQNPTSRIDGEPDITDCVAYGEALGQYALDALSGLKKLQNSEVKLSTKTFVGDTNTHLAEKLETAREIVAYAAAGNKLTTKYLSTRGFATYTEALWVTYRADYYNTPTQQMDLRVLSIGDELGFAIAPYEMFGVNGMQIKEQSPFETTMIITHSEGAMSYLPNEESCDYGAYEYHVSLFEKGTAETLVTEFVDMLDELKGE